MSKKVNLSYVRKSSRKKCEEVVSISKYRQGLLSVQYFTRPIVLPPHNSDCDGGIVEESGMWIPDTGWENVGCGYYHFSKTDIEDKPINAIWLGVLKLAYGHALTDNLKKLWFLETPKGKELLKQGYVPVFTCCIEPPAYIIEIIKLAIGIDLRKCIRIEKVTQIKDIYVPDNSFIYQSGGLRFYTTEFKNTVERLINLVSYKSYNDVKRRVYLTRSHWVEPFQRDYGEIEIEKVFRKCGFEIVVPEKMSVEEQIKLMKECETLVVTEGSIAHNSLFLPKDANLILLRKADYLNTWQLVINEMRDLNVSYVDIHHSVRVDKRWPWAGPFYMCVTKELDKFLGKNIPHIPYWLRFSFLRYYLWYSPFFTKYIRNRRIVKRLFLNN